MANFDPRSVPGKKVTPVGQVRPDIWTPDALRRRFRSPPDWTPERVAEGWPEGGALRNAAVLVGVVLGADGPSVWLIERASHLRAHAGQVAFPGGVVDDSDASAVHAAMREAEEEVALAEHQVELLGTLPEHITGTGFAITPVVALVDPEFQPRPNPAEVASVFSVPLVFLMDSENHRLHRAEWGGRTRQWYSMPYQAGAQERYIWGATAAILRNLRAFLLA